MSDSEEEFEFTLPDVEDLEQYGIGVPFFFFVAASGMFYMAIPGFAMLVNGYAKLGVALLTALSITFFVLSGYFYGVIDPDILQTEEEDAEPPVDRDDEPSEFDYPADAQ